MADDEKKPTRLASVFGGDVVGSLVEMVLSRRKLGLLIVNWAACHVFLTYQYADHNLEFLVESLLLAVPLFFIELALFRFIRTTFFSIFILSLMLGAMTGCAKKVETKAPCDAHFILSAPLLGLMLPPSEPLVVEKEAAASEYVPYVYTSHYWYPLARHESHDAVHAGAYTYVLSRHGSRSVNAYAARKLDWLLLHLRQETRWDKSIAPTREEEWIHDNVFMIPVLEKEKRLRATNYDEEYASILLKSLGKSMTDEDCFPLSANDGPFLITLRSPMAEREDKHCALLVDLTHFNVKTMAAVLVEYKKALANCREAKCLFDAWYRLRGLSFLADVADQIKMIMHVRPDTAFAMPGPEE